jgi:hypothetical protein
MNKSNISNRPEPVDLREGYYEEQPDTYMLYRRRQAGES